VELRVIAAERVERKRMRFSTVVVDARGPIIVVKAVKNDNGMPVIIKHVVSQVKFNLETT
jgi:hypothetical protein